MRCIPPLVTVRDAPNECADCPARLQCIPAGLNAGELAQLDAIIQRRHRIRCGGHLFRAGTELHSLALVRYGSLKSTINDGDGREQVGGFHLSGQLLGLDAIETGRHTTDVVALEDSEVCRLPFAQLQELSARIPALGHYLRREIGREIGRAHRVMMVLGGMRADERVAAFLLDFVAELRARGFSSTRLTLRVTRNEIGSYLGLKLETVSRTFSALQRAGIIEGRGRIIRIVAPEKLAALLEGATLQPPAWRSSGPSSPDPQVAATCLPERRAAAVA